jgi:predicted nucleotidyltransferase
MKQLQEKSITLACIAVKDMARIPIDVDKIADFCRRHHIRRLSLFGSVLRDDFGTTSDVDVLVEFEPSHVPGLAFFSMEEELSQIISGIESRENWKCSMSRHNSELRLHPMLDH